MNPTMPGPARPAKGISSYFAGIMQCILGGVLVFSFGLTMFILAVTGDGTLALQAFFFLFFFGGLWLLLRGIRKCRLYGVSRRVSAVMAGKGREQLAVLAQAVRKDYTALVGDLRELAARGVYPGAYVDLNRKEFVLQPGGAQPPITHGNTQLKEQRRGSAAPIYLLGLSWLMYALVFPMYRIVDLVVAAAVSLLVFVIAARLVSDRMVITEVERKVEPPKPPEKINTGDSELDEVLTTAMGYMAELTALSNAITNEKIKGPLQELVHICKQIFDYIKKTPTKVRQIRQFMSYYLPTAIKLLKNYDELSREPVKGDNIKQTMAKIEDTIQVILKAFRKELDDLYADKAIDISVDIEVLQSMMEQEGLTGNAWQPEKKEN